MMKMFKTIKKEWYILAILLLPYLVAPFIWDQLPEQIPTHFNMQGEPGNYRDTATVFLLFPVVGLVIYFTILLAPYIDPKKRLIVDQKPLPALRLILPLFINGLFFLLILASIREGFDQNFVVYLVVTIMLLILGNYLPTIKPNYFIGLRTPWTLEHPENWKKTHRFGSRIWIVATLTMLLLSFFVSTKTYGYIFFAGVMIMAVTPLAYSFIIYYREEQLQPNGEES